MKYHIFASKIEHIEAGGVWIGSPKLPPRTLICIKNEDTGRSVYCEGLFLDTNFIANYNQAARIHIKEPEKTIVISAWYRKSLGGIETQSDQKLTIKEATSAGSHLRAALQHPQQAMRIATRLGILSVILGIIGIGLGVMSIF